MKKLCSRFFFFVERSYWIFGVNLLSSFSKLQPTRAADCFEALLERSVILWSLLVSERKLPYFGKKFRQVVNFHFTRPQQNFEKKWLKYFSLLSSLLDFQWIFSDFGKKISQVCWNSNLSVQRKRCQKNLLNNWFFVFLDFDKKILWFCRKVFGRVVQNTFDVSSGTLTEQIFRMEVLETRGFSKNFWSFRDNGGKVFQTWQNSNRCPREQFMKNFFRKRKIRSFFRFCAIVYFQRNFLPELRNPQSMYPWEFSGKNNFWNIYIYI